MAVGECDMTYPYVAKILRAENRSVLGWACVLEYCYIPCGGPSAHADAVRLAGMFAPLVQVGINSMEVREAVK